MIIKTGVRFEYKMLFSRFWLIYLSEYNIQMLPLRVEICRLEKNAGQVAVPWFSLSLAHHSFSAIPFHHVNYEIFHSIPFKLNFNCKPPIDWMAEDKSGSCPPDKFDGLLCN